MKKLLLLLLVTAPVMAQHGFKMENGNVVWERFYSIPQNDIKAMVSANEQLSLSSAEEATYTGRGAEVQNTCSSGSTLMKCPVDFTFTIMTVADGYFVRVENFMFLEKYGPMQMRTVPTGLGKHYVERGKIRTTDKANTELACVDSFLSGVFSGGGANTALTAN
ncbi:hypothetical protein AM493_09480 [Flavobacterium akiainvivens]|uniref:DUF4468 domain-containing protein n=1 Tax=Flavobacterium akiainvivens TaxID=1202724 RepID=A0A0M8MAV4_9FLAO|nr:hypothetical protein [Flavobacterium akiainvivens]KOS06235.1 hypothetical protein AM493_09480 [Flavobacterium akiainvivens]SFQ18243.1 hypothetical protein SAMN05444144_101469 [Flavobacterium akiainvivens]